MCGRLWQRTVGYAHVPHALEQRSLALLGFTQAVLSKAWLSLVGTVCLRLPWVAAIGTRLRLCYKYYPCAVLRAAQYVAITI
jgi:hypothetical protein